LTGDIILVAGKGHENYQDIQGVKYDFDDKVVLGEAFS
jgi:UDP-N-acetylmuramoyl-L-alanyl-D-glutamate--2,6-diaminopimelate ligase